LWAASSPSRASPLSLLHPKNFPACFRRSPCACRSFHFLRVYFHCTEPLIHTFINRWALGRGDGGNLPRR
jgi:hypothetical protein